MILKNLLRRKGRTLLAMFGISVGVAAIIALGAMADGIDAGYNSMINGSQADLVLSQNDAMDISLSTVDESIGAELLAMPEVHAVSSMLQGFVQADEIPLFFVFGYPEDSFVLGRFNLIDGVGLDSREAQKARGTPLLLGSTAAETLNKKVGESIFLGSSSFRIIGIYETGDTFEDSGAVIGKDAAQILLGKAHQVNLFYIQLTDLNLRERLETRTDRLYNGLSLSGTGDFADQQILGDAMKAYVWVIAGLAIVIGGVGTMNSQLMAVMERTREIGVLRALGWTSRRVLLLILGESLVVGLAGGVLGILLGWGFIAGFATVAAVFGSTTANISIGSIIQALVIVLILGLVGGLYPAWRASRMAPIEALRYEGGSSGERKRRLPFGGMAIQSLWSRTARTALTLGAIGLTVGSILALDGMVGGMSVSINQMWGAEAEIVLRQAGIADTSYSAIDQRVGEKIAALSEVADVSGMAFAMASLPENPLFIMQGFEPYGFAIQKYSIIEGTRLTGNRQIMLGVGAADALNKSVGETLDVNGTRFKIVAIYESGTGWEDTGAVISLRDAQILAGRPRKSTIMTVKLFDPTLAPALVEKINAQYPDVHAALAGDFADQMPDMQNMDIMMDSISFLAVIVGGVSVMNTMLMAVLERTREIGVLRALGWQRRKILAMILQEALLLGLLGGAAGILLALLMGSGLQEVPLMGDMLAPVWEPRAFIRAITLAITLGVIGGIYPAYRATKMPPVEALRYE